MTKKKVVEILQTGEEIAPEEMLVKESIRKKEGKKTSFRIRE